MEYIKHFSDICDEDLSLVGGKALNLGKLTRAGFHVPAGFCVTTDAYRQTIGALDQLSSENSKSSTFRVARRCYFTCLWEARDRECCR